MVHYVEEPFLHNTSPNRMGVSTFFPAEIMVQAHRELVATLTPPPSALEIVVVKRTARRVLAQHEELLVALAEVFPEYRVRVFLADGHVREHAQMFYNAKAVIAPHGAGLRNIMCGSLSSSRVYSCACACLFVCHRFRVNVSMQLRACGVTYSAAGLAGQAPLCWKSDTGAFDLLVVL